MLEVYREHAEAQDLVAAIERKWIGAHNIEDLLDAFGLASADDDVSFDRVIDRVESDWSTLTTAFGCIAENHMDWVLLEARRDVVTKALYRGRDIIFSHMKDRARSAKVEVGAIAHKWNMGHMWNIEEDDMEELSRHVRDEEDNTRLDRALSIIRNYRDCEEYIYGALVHDAAYQEEMYNMAKEVYTTPRELTHLAARWEAIWEAMLEDGGDGYMDKIHDNYQKYHLNGLKELLGDVVVATFRFCAANASAQVGFVYAATSVSLPGLVKVGCTGGSVDKRMRALYGTSSPTPFVTQCVARTRNPHKMERVLHTALDKFRINPRREYFRISLDTVERIFEHIQVNSSHMEVRALVLQIVEEIPSDKRTVKEHFEQLVQKNEELAMEVSELKVAAQPVVANGMDALLASAENHVTAAPLEVDENRRCLGTSIVSEEEIVQTLHHTLWTNAIGEVLALAEDTTAKRKRIHLTGDDNELELMVAHYKACKKVCKSLDITVSMEIY
jgi:hypothetical protein